MKKKISMLLFCAFLSSNLYAAGSRPAPNQGGQGQQASAADASANSGSNQNNTGNSGSAAPAASGNSSGVNTQGTIWDHVPEGGSIRAQANGSWDVLDKNGNVVKNMSDSAAKGSSQNTQPPASSDSGGVNLKGTIWDDVPEGGAIRAQADGSWDVLDRNGNVIKNVKAGDASGRTDSKPAKEPAAETNENTPPPPVQHVDHRPDGSTVTHTQNPDGTWKHQIHREDADGNVVDYELKPDDPGYPKGDPLYDPPKPYDPMAPKGDGPFQDPLESGNGYIRSWRDKNGKWHHELHKELESGGVLDFEMDEDHPLYPENDPRFPKPLPPIPSTQTSSNFGDDLGVNRMRGALGAEVAMADNHGGESKDSAGKECPDHG